jgi:hypothetical protein
MKNKNSIKKVKASHFKIYSEVIINAPANKVWEVLSDVKSYERWAKFMVGVEGAIEDGNKIKVKFQLNDGKEKFNFIEHTIQVKDGQWFYWAEKGPMGICDNHHFIVEPIDENTSRFIQKDELTKGATWLLGGYLSKVYLKGYELFNEQLKKEVEKRNS